VSSWVFGAQLSGLLPLSFGLDSALTLGIAAEAARKKAREKDSAKTSLEAKKSDVKKLVDFFYGQSALKCWESGPNSHFLACRL